MTTKCPVCGDQFDSTGGVREHAWETHGACHHCGAAFDDESSLHVHWLAGHGDDLSRVERERARNDVGDLSFGDRLTHGDPVGAFTETRTGRRAVLAGGGVVLAGGGVWATGLLGGGGSSVGPDALSAPYRGAKDAPVVVRAWEDFGCPHCREYNEKVLPRLVENYVADDAIRYERHDFPIPVSQWSWPVASAARSVQSTAGDDAFFTFSEAMYANQSDLGWSLVRERANRVGAPADTVVSQGKSGHWRPVVKDDKQAGRDRGVDGTPTVFVGDTEVSFENSYDEFYRNIADAVDRRLDG